MKFGMRFAVIIGLSCMTFGCKGQESSAPAEDKPAEEKRAATKPAAEEKKETSKAPDRFAVKLETTKGDIIIDVHKDWSPNGADRFYELVTGGYYKDVAFFRVIEGFMAQAGIHGDPKVNEKWRSNGVQDDAVKESNTRGMVTFAMSGRPNSRTTQFFINLSDNSRLDKMRFAPFGKVRDMGTVDALYNGYGEGAPQGRGPSQKLVQTQGNAYLKEKFPKLDYIVEASIME